MDTIIKIGAKSDLGSDITEADVSSPRMSGWHTGSHLWQLLADANKGLAYGVL
jgi:hypothetical protein